MANAVPQVHHALGVVYGDDGLQGMSQNPTAPPGFTLGDNFDRIDVDAGISVTSKTTSTAASSFIPARETNDRFVSPGGNRKRSFDISENPVCAARRVRPGASTTGRAYLALSALTCLAN